MAEDSIFSDPQALQEFILSTFQKMIPLYRQAMEAYPLTKVK